jgi:probable HAF family extracellular repeat protein
MFSLSRSSLCAAAITLFLLARGATSRAQSYTITDLGTASGDQVSIPYGLNNLGGAVGVSETPSAANATLFSAGSDTNLGFLDGQPGDNVSIANGINDTGQIAGSALANDAFHAFLDSNGKMTDINSASAFPGGSRGYAINRSGQVVGLGYLDSSGAMFHAFLYSGGKMVDIGPPGAYQASASAINDAGQIIGSSFGGTISGVFLYSNGQFTTLPIPSGSSGISANAINNAGQIAGAISFTSGAPSHAAVFSNGAWIDLGVFPGAPGSTATGINSSGQVVGWARFPNTGTYHRPIPGKLVIFIYRNGALVDLNTLIPANSGLTIGGNPPASEAGTVRINDTGQILCTAKTAAGVYHAVLLTPQ